MTIDEITKELQHQDDPFTLSEYLTVLSSYASSYNEMMKKVQLVKSQQWLDIKKHDLFSDKTVIPGVLAKPLSDKQTDMVWYTTADGQKEIALKYELQRIETMASAIKRRLYAQKVDFKAMNPGI